MSFIACGDDDSSGREVITEVNSIFELGTCGEDNEGDTVYAKEQDAEYYCHEAKWSPVAPPSLIQFCKIFQQQDQFLVHDQGRTQDVYRAV